MVRTEAFYSHSASSLEEIVIDDPANDHIRSDRSWYPGRGASQRRGQGVLIADDNEGLTEALATALDAAGYEVTVALNGDDALEYYLRERHHYVLLDLMMPGLNGVNLIRRLAQEANRGPSRIVVMSGMGSTQLMASALEAGAAAFLQKPFSMDQAISAISKEPVESCAEQVQARLDWAKLEERFGVCFCSGHLREVAHLAFSLHRVPSTPVLIQGETGCGKEVVARLVHEGSEGSGRPFVDINCAAIPESLFESELFGYESGAFSGADRKGRPGHFELADNGTLLLDELGEMPLDMQAKLLRVLEEGTVRRVGGSTSRKIDVRVIGTTNRDLLSMVREGRFRSDLYYRLNVGIIRLKPLKERRSEIPGLTLHFLLKSARSSGKFFNSVEREALQLLQEYPWPGNVRELRNAIHRAVLYDSGPTLSTRHLSFLKEPGHVPGLPQANSSRQACGGEIGLPEDHFDLLAWERAIIEKALRKNDENKSQTARYLGLTRSKLLTRLKQLGLT